ncbi:Na+/H+ antiporter subunit E [Rhodococcus triatomae]|uniref:Multicomponent Na+:H+ antiporter subunit E n=1 Tax=Rhodococcus triatomae TaxID=300028 RepID=A0A1G8NDX0_9NOCA|nr:Na+/H+ antiporter subunit E [Rhodococcus triatomae]QNG19963.1 Na+/H+ antiporter subunit E [Rhodococcus triatomae]QNG24122.1 Na+/H+ antiporter subunit E [Rhodococcus triatomae]SDI77720.1 multicomponent Na+:H+ antiporter subunit E [Rhodococcus triatomae]
MTRSGIVQIGALAWLTLVWVALWGSVTPGNIVAGLAVAVTIMVLLPLPHVPVEGRVHLLSLLKLLGVVIMYTAQSSIQVSWLAIRPSPPPVTGVLRHQFSIKSDLVLTLCIDVMNNIPGTMVIELDQARRIAYIHVLDVGSEKSVQQFYRTIHRLESLFIDAFERDSDWKPSPWHANGTAAAEASSATGGADTEDKP